MVKERSKPVAQSRRAHLTFPVGRTGTMMRKARLAERVTSSGPVFMAACIEYMVRELIDLSGDACKDKKMKTIKPRHIQLALRGDEELCKIAANMQIASGGTMSNLHSFLFKN